MKRVLVAAALAAAALGVVLPAAGAGALPIPTAGNLRVTVSAPDGVPANVVVAGRTTVFAAKPTVGESQLTPFTLPVGAYHVTLPRVVFDGVPYVGSAPENVTVRPDATTDLVVRYAAEPGARDLHATAVTGSTVTLAWTGSPTGRYKLLRTAGPNPVKFQPRPTEIRTKGTVATDTGLQPGTSYSYWLYTMVEGQWNGPLPVAVGTTPPSGSTEATFVASASTLLATAADIAAEATTGVGVQVELTRPIPALLLGAGVVLPISADLPGGYLGVVTAISSDGRTITLAPGSLADAFDYYQLDVKSFASDFGGPVTAPTAAAAGRAREPKARAAAVSGTCTGTVTAPRVSFTPNVVLAGSFVTKLDKHSALGVDIPVGASLDMSLTATVTGAATITAAATGTCTVTLPKISRFLTVTPVPISVSLAPRAVFSATGAVKLTGFGMTATGGVHIAGTMSVSKGSSFSGNPILTAAPIVPSVTANGAVRLKLGGDIELGPGADTENAGVIAAIDGTLYPLDAALHAAFAASDPRFNLCSVASAAFTRSMSLTAKAWFSKWKFGATVAVPALGGSTAYPGSPWHLPTGCENAPGPAPQDTLLGDGVTKIGDSTVGSVDQWGHVDGFIPGKKTWVLSTGRIADALGVPGKFADTTLGLPGDAQLSALAGHPTFDAAAYTVTLVPTGHTLHVRYVFASEEYPEYVGSQFNDVMAVRINGQNCATVPGSGEAVSINTINAQRNSAFYVDNSTGAAGYATSMDGLTQPLTCSVPVTPGQQVTVQVAVADTSDGRYDSAVALVDGGIWTD